jgi:hypothetical protein
MQDGDIKRLSALVDAIRHNEPMKGES